MKKQPYFLEYEITRKQQNEIEVQLGEDDLEWKREWKPAADDPCMMRVLISSKMKRKEIVRTLEELKSLFADTTEGDPCYVLWDMVLETGKY